MSTGLGRAVVAGAAYFGVVFAIGFVLGTVRVLMLVPHIGEAVATIIELPIMLMLSWFACRWLVSLLIVPSHTPIRLSMGAVAFSLLMLGELSVSMLGFGRTLPQHLTNYLRPLPALGLAAQVLFALFPVVAGHPGLSRAQH